MSILTGPRLNFWGGIRTDVSVPNNSPYLGYDNQDKTLELFDLTTSTVASEAATYSDDALNALINAPFDTNTPEVHYTNSGWNHYGQHVVDMQNALISSQGKPGNISTKGDLVGQPVYLLGSIDPNTKQGPFSGPMMVDLDPTSTETSQIFVGGLQIGDGNTPELLIRYDTVCSSIDVAKRLLVGEKDAPGSSVASGTFQLTFPLSSVVSYNKKSKILKSIMDAPNATGIALRFVMFEMCPTMTTEQLNANYAAKQDSPNPSIGRVVGTIGPAFVDEPLIVPTGRQITNDDTGGTGYASLIDSSMLSVDMLNIVPKASFRSNRDDITSPIGPNVNYGKVSINAGNTNLSTLNPDSAHLNDYYLYGGIVDISLNEKQHKAAQTNPLQIKAPNKVAETTLNAQELPYRIYSNQRNEYIDNNAQMSVTLQLRHLGQTVTDAVEIDISAEASGPSYTDAKYWNLFDFPPKVKVLANENSVNFDISIKKDLEAKAGFTKLVYSMEESKSYDFFSCFRKYAQTDFGIAPGSTITWDQVYKYVLRFHYLAFPAMSRFIPLNQEDAVVNAKVAMLARTSDEFRNTTLYMPIVRSMSNCQVALLKAFLMQQPWQPPTST